MNTFKTYHATFETLKSETLEDGKFETLCLPSSLMREKCKLKTKRNKIIMIFKTITNQGRLQDTLNSNQIY